MGTAFVILLYHGVTRSQHRGIENYSRKHLMADEFARQMATLAERYHVMSFRELLERKRKADLPPRTVAVTFDDGFENNYSTAYPILKQYNVPATFFLATGFIGKERVFWVDKLEYLLNETPQGTIELKMLGNRHPLRSLEEREAAVRSIKQQLKSDSSLVDDVIAELEQVTEVPLAYDYEDYRTMTWDQAREMEASGLCDFGAHTVDHAILSHLSTQEQRYQIVNSQSVLQAELNQAVDLFSYPEGQPDHYSDETIRLLKEAGFVASPSAVFGLNHLSTSNFHLRRNMVGFAASFEECLGVLS
jgi:peptidoglycan/xylan/chitin deacetylase (PgdA/CDA1 family)